MSRITRKYNYFYKITNNINGFFYYGVHSTDNLNDGYMGSGSRLRIAHKEFGVENFTKEILKFFDTKEDAFDYEASVVTESLVNDDKCYNLKLGGGDSTVGMVTVRDKEGNTFNVYKDDPRYLSGELVGVTFGRCVAIDETGKIMCVDCNDPRFNSGELKHINKGICTVMDSSGNSIRVGCDDARLKNGELTGFNKNMAIVRDNTGRYYRVRCDDPRIKSGELVHAFKNRKHTEETKKKIGESNKKNHSGILNSQYGTCWIYNDYMKITKKVNKYNIDNYISNGWKMGRKMSYHSK